MIGTEAAVVSAAVSGILKILGNKLAPLLIKKYRYSAIVGVQSDLKELQDQVEEINYWLETVGDKAMGNTPSFNWLKKLKDVAYDVDDVVDEFQLKAEKNEAVGEGGVMSKYLFNKPKSFVFQCKAATKIRAIKKRFAAIVRQRTEFSLIASSLEVGCPGRPINMTTNEMPSLPIVNAATIIGRDQEKRQIISKLVENNDQERIKIVAIIGLGGSGKTTLAQLVFNDDSIIEKNFDIKLWVHVSQVFDVAKLIEKLFEDITDDVWTQDRVLWDKFMVHLESGTPESGILLTTRSKRIGEAVGSTNQFDLPFLSPGDSWQLFKQTLVMPAKGWDFDFDVIGKEIVKKCGGVPLAIKVLAGALRGKELMGEWQAMRDNSLLDIEGQDRDVSVSACLRLSYFHMPSHLKQCFTICSVFPKGRLIDKEQLIDQWIAHDMIAPAAGVDYMEYTGQKYFNSLVQMSFLQEVDECYGRVRCRMHDLVHDLAWSIVNDEISLVVPVEAIRPTKNYRYFSLVKRPEHHVPENIFEKARAIYVDKGDDIIFGKALKNAKHLRSITAESIYAAAVPPAIFQVKNLRYLKMSRLQCVALPETLSDIWSLQALHVTCCLSLELPKSIGKLQKMRTLNMSVELPEGIGKLKKLGVLNLERCRGLRAFPEGIGQLSRLWNLSIARVMNPDDAYKACLKQKTNLHRLRLYWGKTELGRGRGHMEDVNTEVEQAVFDGLEPPSEIKEIEIVGYGGEKRYALWMLKQAGGRAHFPFLMQITLSGFPNLRHLEGLVELPCLEKLTLRWMRSLESISGGPFPSLVSLVMQGMDRLGEVWMMTGRTLAGEEEQMQIGTRLSYLHIDGCPNLVVKPHLPSSREQLKLERSNKQLLQSPGQDKGSSSSSNYGPYYFSRLKKLELWKMAASSSSPPPQMIAS
ncbi:hypothetical protein EJB05_22736, partial [Eragrostis curvula]